MILKIFAQKPGVAPYEPQVPALIVSRIKASFRKLSLVPLNGLIEDRGIKLKAYVIIFRIHKAVGPYKGAHPHAYLKKQRGVVSKDLLFPLPLIFLRLLYHEGIRGNIFLGALYMSDPHVNAFLSFFYCIVFIMVSVHNDAGLIEIPVDLYLKLSLHKGGETLRYA